MGRFSQFVIVYPLQLYPLLTFDLSVNAVDIDDEGNYLISLRHFHQVLKIDKDSGDIIWRLGGKVNDFYMGNGTNVSRLRIQMSICLILDFSSNGNTMLDGWTMAR